VLHTQVTALLIAMETKRALVIDLFDRSVGDSVAPERRTPWFAPYSETYNRTIDLSKEQLAQYAENGAQVVASTHTHTHTRGYVYVYM
jgi:hypothetical protein